MMEVELDHNGNPLLVNYKQLKNHLSWVHSELFNIIESYNLTYEVTYSFNRLFRSKYGDNSTLEDNIRTEYALMLQEAMMEWDL